MRYSNQFEVVQNAVEPQRQVAVRRLKVPKVIWNHHTVGDMDRVNFMRRNRHFTVEQVSEKLSGTALAAGPSKLRHLAAAFQIDMRKSAYEAAQ